MVVIRFPKSPGAGDPGPRKIYVCAPGHEDLLQATRKLGFGYSKKEAQIRFYEGGLNHGIETRVSNLKTAPDWLKFWLTNQFLMHIENGQPLSPVEEEARERLGPDPYEYGDRLRKAKKPKGRRR
jgi:hypothetical protein